MQKQVWNKFETKVNFFKNSLKIIYQQASPAILVLMSMFLCYEFINKHLLDYKKDQ